MMPHSIIVENLNNGLKVVAESPAKTITMYPDMKIGDSIYAVAIRDSLTVNGQYYILATFESLYVSYEYVCEQADNIVKTIEHFVDVIKYTKEYSEEYKHEILKLYRTEYDCTSVYEEVCSKCSKMLDLKLKTNKENNKEYNACLIVDQDKDNEA